MTTYFTADLHLGHEKIVGMAGRPFDSIEEHDDVLIGEINRVVAEGDRLYVLGDFCWGDAEQYIGRINCLHVYLIRGNHDRVQNDSAFNAVFDTLDLKNEKGRIFLSHYPNAYWPASHYGSFHLYGHMHGEREETLDACFPDRRSMDVGVDNVARLYGNYGPLSESEVIEHLSKRAGHDPIQFYIDREAARNDKPST